MSRTCQIVLMEDGGIHHIVTDMIEVLVWYVDTHKVWFV